jgi:aspartyl protease family protein
MYAAGFVSGILVMLIVNHGMTRSSPAEENQSIQAAVSKPKEVSPFKAEAPGQLAASLRKRNDGHYWANAKVNRAHMIDFMVDSGASIVALTTEDARRLGYDFRKMEKDRKISTAGGIIYGASLNIERLEIGRVMVKDIDAVILDEGLEQSLLGNTFLNRLSRRDTTDTVMIIHQ